MNPEPLSTWATDPDEAIDKEYAYLREYVDLLKEQLADAHAENTRLSREVDSLKNTKHPAY